jgi:hypothetical protein
MLVLLGHQQRLSGDQAGEGLRTDLAAGTEVLSPG